MACGCPVITSNKPTCSEVAGDAALMVNLHSINDITNAMKQLVEDKSLCELLRQKGLFVLSNSLGGKVQRST